MQKYRGKELRLPEKLLINYKIILKDYLMLSNLQVVLICHFILIHPNKMLSLNSTMI